LLKRKRFGRTSNAGFYDYSDGKRSQELSPSASELAESYCRERTALSDGEVQQLLSIPMWIEAVLAARDGIVTSNEQFETAMKGGLGFAVGKSWIGCFDSLGSEAICEADDRWGGITASMKIPDAIRQLLQESSPSDVLLRSRQ
jgi:3-hydroxyacyl-CoA dehydrogenase